MQAQLHNRTQEGVPMYRNGKHLCRDFVRLCRGPAYHSCSQAQRLLPCLATGAQTSSSSGGASQSGQHQLSIRRQLQTGGDLSRAALTRYKVGQLREALQEEGLSTAGLKAHLVERLFELVETLDPHTVQLDSGPASSSSVQQSSTAQLSQDVLTASQHKETTSSFMEAEPEIPTLVDEAATSSISAPAPTAFQAQTSVQQVMQTDSSSESCVEREGSAAAAVTEARQVLVAQSSSQDQLSIRRELQAGTTFTPALLSRYRVAQLREALEEEGLSTLGTKAVLVSRTWELVGALQARSATLNTPQESLADSVQHGSRAQPWQDMSTLSGHEGSDSAVSEAQLDFKSPDEDGTPSQSTPEHPSTPSMASLPQTSEMHSSRAAGTHQHISSAAMADVQDELNGQSAVENDQSLSAAAVPVSVVPAPIGASFARDLDTPDRAANKTGLAVTWLGTSSGAPTTSRNVSCIAVRLPSSTFLVDSGEGSCRQLEQAQMHPGRVKGLFVTHLHGDHCFGIPGLLRSVSDSRVGTALEGETFRIFGPPGLHGLITAAFAFDATPPCMPLAVTEWTVQPSAAFPLRPASEVAGVDLGSRVHFARAGPDMSPEVESLISKATKQARHQCRRGFTLPEHDVTLIEGLTWTVPCEDGITLTAAQLQHRLPCWGYVFREAGCPPLPDPAKLAAAGASEEAVQSAIVKGPQATVELPSGEQVPVKSLVIPPVKGRKVVLLGDTCDSHAILNVGRSADLLSHEATFTADMYAKARIAQHSTAPMAGNFARQLGAQTLVLTHFSGRFAEFRGRGEEDALPRDIHALKMQATHTFGSNRIFAASDFFTYQVPRKTSFVPPTPSKSEMRKEQLAQRVPAGI